MDGLGFDRRVQTEAAFPDGNERKGLQALRSFLREKRQDDFIEKLCRKWFSYALGRGMLLSDKQALDDVRAKLAADGYVFGSLVDAIVTSPQFRNKKGRDDSQRW